MLIIGTEKDTYANRFPWITLSLVAINVVVYVAQEVLGPEHTVGMCLVAKEIATGKDLVGTHKITHEYEVLDKANRDARGKPIRRKVKEHLDLEHYAGPVPIHLTFFTSMFMHAGLAHLIGNMWFLWIFGRNVEGAMNHGLYLFFYLICGLCSGIVQVLFDTESIIPCLGASGAISGVMAAYGSVFPFHKVKLWLGLLVGVIECPALFVIGFWVALQYIFGYLEWTNPNKIGGIAYGAHLGGFGAGFVIVWSLLGILYFQKIFSPEEDAEVLPPLEEKAERPPGEFPEAPNEAYDFGQYYVQPGKYAAKKPEDAGLGDFYPKQ